MFRTVPTAGNFLRSERTYFDGGIFFPPASESFRRRHILSALSTEFPPAGNSLRSGTYSPQARRTTSDEKGSRTASVTRPLGCETGSATVPIEQPSPRKLEVVHPTLNFGRLLCSQFFGSFDRTKGHESETAIPLEEIESAEGRTGVRFDRSVELDYAF